MSSPLVVVAAAAGSGKTVLASNWVQQRAELGGRTGWLSLDMSDNDPPRFWRYFAAALEVAVAGLPDPIEYEIASPSVLRPEDRFGGLIEHLTTTKKTAVVVLDDYHVVQDESIHEHLAFLCEQTSGLVCLVVLSRGQPPLPLARLRSRGLLAEITNPALALTVDETGELLTRELSTLSPRDIERLYQQTEGWPVGVYLAALSLATHEAPGEFIAEVAGDEQNIVDYLGAELLSGLSEDERRFLFRTSLLERFCAPLCAAVIGQANAPEILDRLARANCLIVSLDRRRYWHRYHHLFAEFLRNELVRREPESIHKLHRLAAEWLAERELGPEAISHALAAEHWDLAARLIGQCWEAQRNQGARKTLVSWLDALPPGRVDDDPALLVARAWTWLSDGNLKKGDEVHHRLAAMIESGRQPSDNVVAEFFVNREKLELLRGESGRALEDAREAARIEHEWSERDPGRGISLVGAALFWRDPGAARAPLMTAIELATVAGEHVSVLLAQGYLAAMTEDPDRAEALADEALARAKAVGLGSHFLNSMPRLVLSRCRRLQGQLDQSKAESDAALELARVARTPLRTAYCLLEKAELRHASGESVVDTMTEVRRLAAECPDPGRLTDLVAQASARFRLPLSTPEARLSLVEPLTERELAVLAYLPSDSTQRQIAEALFVSTNTVKTHVQAIYRKLGVTSRGAAVQQASELHLLPTTP